MVNYKLHDDIYKQLKEKQWIFGDQMLVFKQANSYRPAIMNYDNDTEEEDGEINEKEESGLKRKHSIECLSSIKQLKEDDSNDKYYPLETSVSISNEWEKINNAILKNNLEKIRLDDLKTTLEKQQTKLDAREAKIKEYFVTKETELNNKIKEVKKMELEFKLKANQQQLQAIKKEYEDLTKE